jgi:hypothetical protein
MARLGKHGTELLRIAVETDVMDSESSVTWRRLTRSYMSDGKILEKLDVTFRPSFGAQLWSLTPMDGNLAADS